MENSNDFNIVQTKKRKHDIVKQEMKNSVVGDERSTVNFNDTSESSASSETNDSTDLPLHWIKYKSKRYGRDYYFNSSTGETIWEHPKDYLIKKRQLGLLDKPDLRPEKSSTTHVSPLKRDKMRHERNRRHRHKSDDDLSPSMTDLFPSKTSEKQVDFDSFRDSQLDNFGVKPKVASETRTRLVSMESLSDGELVDDEPMDVDVVEKFRSDLCKPMANPVSFVEDSPISWDIFSVESNVGIFLVVDTNVFISNLNFVKSLKELRFFGSKPVVIVVPYVVLQELDVLKDSDRRSTNDSRSNKVELVQCTRDAINFIYRELSVNSPFILIQPSKVDAEPFKSFDVKRNDDRVLKCYAQLNTKMKDINSDSVVILCTNDKNLLIKAFANEFIAGTESQLKILLPDIAADPNKYLRASTSSRYSQPENSNRDINGNLPDLTNVKGLLEYSRQVLSKIVEDEFRKIYTENADRMFAVKPPWYSLKMVVEVILKHWVAVYRYVWLDDSSNGFKWLDRFHALYKLLIKSPTPVDEIEAIKLVVKLLEQFTQRITCPNIVAVNRLLGGIRKFIANQEVSLPADDVQSPEIPRRKRLQVIEPPPPIFKPRATVEEVCDRVWLYIEETKNACCQSLVQSLQSDDDQRSKAENNLRLLMTAIDTLVDSMDTVFCMSPGDSDKFRSSAQKFCNLLNNFPETVTGEKNIIISPLDVDVFEAFITVEANRSVFIDAGTHLVSVTNDIKNKLEAFGMMKSAAHL